MGIDNVDGAGNSNIRRVEETSPTEPTHSDLRKIPVNKPDTNEGDKKDTKHTLDESVPAEIDPNIPVGYDQVGNLIPQPPKPTIEKEA